MFMNPFIEGVILLLLGVGCTILGHVFADATIAATGQTLTGIGIGYLGKSAIESKGAEK